jgi:5-methylthioadenosine/S-adenosylhomocysteine deaminase
MSGAATLYRAAWVAPVTAAPIASGAVRVDAGGRIEAVGPAEVVTAAGAEVIDLGDAVILPGLVNLHGHPELTALRGALDGLAFPDWIERITELKYRVMSPEQTRVSTWLGVAEVIAAGVTCLAAPDDAGYLLEAMVEVGLRGRVYREVFGPSPDQAEQTLEELGRKIETMRRLQSERVDVGISPHAPYTVSRHLLRLLADYAVSESLPVCIHTAESEAEESFVRDGRGPFADRLRARGIKVTASGSTPIAWIAETGILQTRPLLVHCVRVAGGDLARIASSGASVAHCPISNARLGHGVAPLGDLLEAGIPVGLGSDSVASNDRVDVIEEARFADLIQRGLLRAPRALPADRLLRLATLDGARALGLDDRIGSLEPGKEADLVAVRLGEPHTTPVADPLTALFHSARGADVVLTVVAGRTLYRDGAFTGLDWPELASRLETVSGGHSGA